jgi:tRNA(fMet)-specific endonuclease VapC
VRYLLDTNSISYLFRGEGRIAERLLAITPADAGIPAPVLYEARAGVLRLADGARRQAMLGALDQLAATLAVAAFDAAAAVVAARIRAALEAQGTPIGPIDTLIAGTAIARGATLVTRNLREFERVPGLSLENWYDG